MKRIILLASILFIMLPLSAKANLIADPGFETASYQPGFGFNTPGIWFGDNAQIVTGQNGISPFGVRMLSSIYSSPDGSSTVARACDIWQLIDLTSLSAVIASGNAVASASSFFNREENESSSIFEIDLYAYSGGMPSFINQAYLTNETGIIAADNNQNEWQSILLSMVLPSNTNLLALHLSAAYDNPSVNLNGHYFDNITLDIGTTPQETAPVPEPTTLLLLGTGLMGIAGIRKKFKKS